MNENEEVKNEAAEDLQNTVGKTTALSISFDVTGSMRPCIQQVRTQLHKLVKSMMEDMPGLKISLIAHGDYCDGDQCITTLDFTDNLDELLKFITEVPNVSGGDEPECYELVLQTVKSLSWPKEGGSLIMIGDASAHEENPNDIDWREEVAALAKQNVKVFPMQCLYMARNKVNNQFWEELSGVAETPLLMLESFADSANTLEAVAYAGAAMGDVARGADPVLYDVYTAKFAGEVAAGSRDTASQNLCSNQAKLDAYVKGDSTTWKK